MPLQGDQIPLPIKVPKAKRRLWLQLEKDQRLYTYDEFAKEFVNNSWNAKHYTTLGLAKAAVYALGKHKQLKQGGEFWGSQIVVWDADLTKIIDPPEPAPKPAPLSFPLTDNDTPLPWCPECGALLNKPTDTTCPTCNWDATPAAEPSPITLALKQGRSQLMKQIDAIRQAGDIAPKGCSIEPYTVSKKLADGKKQKFQYFRLKSDAGAIFQNKNGKATKSLHLGSASSAPYLQWVERVKRRNAIAFLERQLDATERRLQKLANVERKLAEITNPS